MLKRFNGPGPRTAFRALASGLGTAIAGTVKYFFPETPDFLFIAWGGVFMLSIGLLEAVADQDSGQTPTPPEG
jgi:hypothetical protein